MWRAYLFQTTTGQIGPEIRVEEGATWSVSLNGTETASLTISKRQLPLVDLKYWLSPWWAGVLFTYDGRPIYAGPVIGNPHEAWDRVSLDCGGFRSILARRIVAPELTDWTKLAKVTTSFDGYSLGTIAKKVIQLVQQKSGGSLPISYPIGEQTAAVDADHQRNYRGFNIQNLFCDDVLTKLSNVKNGPDIMLRPRLIDDSRLTMDLYTGTEGRPRIEQANTPVWDTTSERSNVSDMQLTTTGAYQTNRVYAVGAGSDEGTLIRVASNEGPLSDGYPLLETTFASGDTEDGNVAMAHAEGSLRTNGKMLREIQMTVRANGTHELGTFWPGDLVELFVKGWINLSDGAHNARLLNVNGGLTNDVKLSLQIEE